MVSECVSRCWTQARLRVSHDLMGIMSDAQRPLKAMSLVRFLFMYFFGVFITPPFKP
jgi:hypothetical protein